MKVLIVNPILYTSETENIKRVESITDTMIYDLCLAFKKKGIIQLLKKVIEIYAVVIPLKKGYNTVFFPSSFHLLML